MTLLAALVAGLAVFLCVASLTGHGDSLSLRLPGLRRAKLSRAVWLRQAGVSATPAQFWTVSCLVGTAVEFVVWAISGSPYVGVVVAVAAALFPKAYFARKRSANLAAVVAAWPDGIRHLVAVADNRTIHQGLLSLAADGPPALRSAFANYADMAQVGGAVAALAAIGEELADPISDRVIEVLSIAHDQGQALAIGILTEQAGEIAADLRVEAENATARLEPVLTARVAFAAPYVILVMMCWRTPEFAAFYRQPAGLFVIAAGGVLSSLGLVVARKLAAETPEPRVVS